MEELLWWMRLIALPLAKFQSEPRSLSITCCTKHPLGEACHAVPGGAHVMEELASGA